MRQNRTYINDFVESMTGHIVLDRPEVHNAFNIEMIREIADAVGSFNEDDRVRFIVFSANGENFSAGADLKWMKEGLHQSAEELRAESRELALLFNLVYKSEKITIALVNGKALGGANGLVAASDFSFASGQSTFAFSEVKIGLIPATIAPYIVRKTGLQTAYEWMLTGKSIPADEAARKGLVTEVVESNRLKNRAVELTDLLKMNSPAAMQGIKKLFHNGGLEGNPDDMVASTADLIASFRGSEEAQEGIHSFFEKRKPNWTDE